MSHNFISELNRFFDTLLGGLEEIKLENRIVSKLSFSDDLQFSLLFSEDNEYGQEFGLLICVFESVKSSDYDLRILLKIDEHVLVFLDPLELPIWAVEHEVKVQLSVTGELYLDVLAHTMHFGD